MSNLEIVRLRRWFVAALTGTLALRLAFAAAVPMTSDEAYFFYWARHPGFGYFDHPPMVAWWLMPFAAVSGEAWVARLPAVLVPVALALTVVALLRDRDPARAYLAGLALALAPVAALYIPVTTDTPLIFFSLMSFAAFTVAVRRDSSRHYLLAGALLGCAALSKYFSVLLGFAFLVYGLSSPPRERRLRGVMLVMLAAAPLVAVNLWWNYNHCWANVLHNVYNRNQANVLSWRTPLQYLLVLLYLLGPVLAWQFLRSLRALREAWGDPVARLSLVVALLPLCVLGALSLWRPVGLHWALSFVPIVFVLAGSVLSARQLLASAKFLGVFSALHVVAAAAVLALPLETWRGTGKYEMLVFAFKPNEVFAALRPYDGEYALATDGYSQAMTLWFATGREFVVFGAMSHHSRQYDFETDLRALDGKNIAVLFGETARIPEYRTYFRSLELREIEVEGATYQVALGRGFDLEAYRQGILVPTRDLFYRIPRFLPQGGCPFCDRYFDGAACPVR